MANSENSDNKWGKIPSDLIIAKALDSLKKNGINTILANSKEDAKRKVLDLIPEGSEVMTMSSLTLDTASLSEEINKSGRFNAVRDKLYSMDMKTQKQEMNKLGAAPQYALGSVQAITEDGYLLMASATGSQLSAYAYSALKVIWVVGAQKIVKNTDEGIKRIYEYCLPLENERAKKAYGRNSNVGKILIVNKEPVQDRITLVLVKEKLGV